MTAERIFRKCGRFLLSAGMAGWLLLPALGLAADGVAPTTPGNFQSRVENEEAIVALSWNASTDSAGIKAYRIDRSLDQQNWSTLTDNLTTLTYLDKTVGFGVHYFYRLNATDATGSVSGWAITDVSTNSNTPVQVPKVSSIFTSEDGIAAVEIPNGATSAEVSCTVALKKNPVKPSVADHALAAGPYSLSCRTVSGDVVREFKEAVSWTFNLEAESKGLKNPAVYEFDGDSRAAVLVEGSAFDATNKTLKVAVWTSDAMAVLVEVSKGVSPNLVVLILVVFGIIVGVIMLVLRQRKKATYDEYMRSKYYDI